MEWNNLKNLRCPKCNAKLVEAHHGLGYVCSMKETIVPCLFSISYERFQEIVKNIYQPRPSHPNRVRIISEEENQRELNNL